ncbi:MAG: tRNA lysidine(34) synthetase TilS [Gemmatimonadales bacterium]
MKCDAKAGASWHGVAAAIASLPAARYLLAVSGGRDSMVLLDAFVRERTDAIGVATFDHGTGAAATRAVRLVHREAARRGMRVVSVRCEGGAATEEAWRTARWRFLRRAAAEQDATVVTAHTRDDQLETVVLRALRDPRHTGPRGLAAMYAASPIVRPLLGVSRDDVASYALARGVRFSDDPTNRSRAYLRNRVRLDLLPALERVQPGFGEWMLELSLRAARWRSAVEAIVDSLVVDLPAMEAAGAVVIPATALTVLSPPCLAVIWPAIAGRAGIALDWRGTERLVGFTTQSKVGGEVPLSGGARVERTASTFVLRASRGAEPLY